MREKDMVVVVTGGAGFLGRAVIRALAGEEREPVLRAREARVFDLRPGLGSDQNGFSALPVPGDVRDGSALRRVCQGADVVLHLAAMVDWGVRPPALVRAVNVGGTANVVAACLTEGVPALVHVSSEDAVHDGGPICDGDESLPYPDRFPNAYCQTKSESERMALEANGELLATPGPGGQSHLRVATIRPCSIWGGGDAYHLESLLDMARRMPLPRMGNGRARFSGVYVDNAAHLVLLAAKALLEDRPGVAGEVFYATDYPARNFFDFFEPMLASQGLRMLPWRFAVPASLAYALGALNEAAAAAIRPVVKLTPKLSRYGVRFICQDHTYKTDKAARVLGYAPLLGEAEAVARTIAHYQKQ